jgi:hypothetical protein
LIMTCLSRGHQKQTRGPQVWRGRPVPGTSFLSIPVRAQSFQRDDCGDEGKASHRSLGGCAVASLRESAELLDDQIDRADPLAVTLEAVLPKPATHVNQVALADMLVDVGLDRLPLRWLFRNGREDETEPEPARGGRRASEALRPAGAVNLASQARARGMLIGASLAG